VDVLLGDEGDDTLDGAEDDTAWRAAAARTR
jgi:hypothetical protein